MRHPHLLNSETTALLVIDMQEAFRSAIPDFDAIAKRIAIAAQAAALLKLPIFATEQSPQKLGRTVPEIASVIPQGTNALEKTAFSSCGAAGFLDQLKRSSAKQILICGIEAHVCVNQTAHDLLAEGFQVHLLLDCISSRSPADKSAGLQKMMQSGAIPSSVELAVFELMRDAHHEHFRAIQKLIK